MPRSSEFVERSGSGVVSMRELSFKHFVDQRGSLLPIEFGELLFPVRRIFTVMGTEPAVSRGNHLVPCEQLLVLVSGAVEVNVRHRDGSSASSDLDEPGSAVWVRPGGFISYTPAGPQTMILVLASEPYGGEDR